MNAQAMGNVWKENVHANKATMEFLAPGNLVQMIAQETEPVEWRNANANQISKD